MVSGFFSPFLHLCPHFCDIVHPVQGPPGPGSRGCRGVPWRGGGGSLHRVGMRACSPYRTQPDHAGHSRTTAGHSRTHRTRPDTPDTTGHNRTVFPDTSGQGHAWCCPKRAGQHRTQNGQTGQYSGQYSGQLRTAHRTAHRTLTGHPPDTTGHTGQPDTHGSGGGMTAVHFAWGRSTRYRRPPGLSRL